MKDKIEKIKGHIKEVWLSPFVTILWASAIVHALQKNIGGCLIGIIMGFLLVIVVNPKKNYLNELWAASVIALFYWAYIFGAYQPVVFPNGGTIARIFNWIGRAIFSGDQIVNPFIALPLIAVLILVLFVMTDFGSIIGNKIRKLMKRSND